MARDLASSAMDADDTFGYGTEMDVAGAALPRRKAWDRLSWSDDVLLLRGCHNQKGADLLAVAGSSKVEVFQLIAEDTGTAFRSLASFWLGVPSSALVWSPAATSPHVSETSDGAESWRIELVVAGADNKLRLLSSQGPSLPPSTTLLGDDTYGPFSKVNDMAWCSVAGYESVFATAGEDGNLLLWNLSPPEASQDIGSSKPTVRAFRLSSRLLSVSFHSSLASMIMVLDATGVIRILDWLSASSTEAAKPSEIDGLSDASKHTILTFSDPRSLAGSLTHAKRAHGAAAWKSQDPNVFGALLDGRWCVFDLRRLSGGKPIAVGEAHGSDGIGAFRWCPTNAHLFATFTCSPSSNAPVLAFDSSFPSAPRTISSSALLGSAGGMAAGAAGVRGAPVADISWLGAAVGSAQGLLGSAQIEDVLAVGTGRDIVLVPMAGEGAL